MTQRIRRLEDLAALAGVSTATASRALSDSASVSVVTRQKLWRLAREHGYRAPRADQGADGATIAVVTPSLADPILLQLAGAIADAAAEQGDAVRIACPPLDDVDDVARTIRAHRADGVIFLADAGLHEAFNRLATEEERFIVWGPKRPDQAYCSIGASDLIGGRRAMLHLARAGRRRIAFVGDTGDAAVMQRYRGYLDAHDAAARAPDPALVVADAIGFAGGQAAIEALIERGTAIDAIVAGDDPVALGVINALHFAGRTVPGDVAVIGFGDLAAGRLTTPALSTISCDMTGAARRMIDMLARNAGPLRSERLPADVVIRESCGGGAVASLSGAI